MATARQSNVTCHRCGRSYRALSSPATIAFKLKNGKGIYCPSCVIARQRETMTRVNLERYNSAESMLTEWEAPCGKTIVPKARRRCRTFLERGCEQYGRCLDFAARQNWDGWRIA